MSFEPRTDVTRLLGAWSAGDETALEQLLPIVYEELKRMAKRYMHSQPSAHTLQTTALINEAYVKLAEHKDRKFADRTHFFAVAATAMRHILVDHARTRATEKRGGGQIAVEIDDAAFVTVERAAEIVALDEALISLAAVDPRKSRVVELRYFGGMTIEETAAVLDVSIETVSRDWRFAKSWLRRELS